METGTLGGTRRLQQLDVVSAEARAAIAKAADRLRALDEELRAALEPGPDGNAAETADARRAGDAAGAEVETARALVGRLEAARRELDSAAETIASAGSAHSPQQDATSAIDQTDAGRAVLRGQEQERARLAEELHDGPAQALANAIFQTEIIGRTISGDATGGAELATLRKMLQRELDSLRAYISQLRPSLLEEQGFEDALRESAAQLQQRSGIPVVVSTEAGAEELDDASRAVALRVAQEAMRNVGKHAAASRAWVRTTRREKTDGEPSAWTLEVGDDGRGFDAGEAQARADRRHFGLRFMRERAELVGAELAIDTAPAVGTVVRLSISTGGERSEK